MTSEYSAFSEPASDSSAAYTAAYNKLSEAYTDICVNLLDVVSAANLNSDTKLEDIGLTSDKYVALYYNFYEALGKMREVNDGIIKASISTIDGKVKLAVTKDGLQTAGLTVEDAHITLDAAKTTVKGDLTVQGAITDSTSYVGMDGTLWSPDEVGELEKSADNLLVSGQDGLFVPIDMTTVKSVQIQTTDPSLATDGAPASNIPALVTLPMYDEVDLGCVVSNASVKIPAFRRSGTHVLIRNAFALSYNQWSKGDGWTDADLRRNIATSAVYICSDPRTLALSNYAAETPVVSPDARDASGKLSSADWFKGRMYLNGRAGRWLCLLPGQQVELVSVINVWQTGSNTPAPYLGWYVVGGEGMDWLEKTVSMRPPTTGYYDYDAVFRSTIDGGEHFGVGSADKYHDAFFGYAQMSDTSSLSETIVVTLSEDHQPYITIE